MGRYYKKMYESLYFKEVKCLNCFKYYCLYESEMEGFCRKCAEKIIQKEMIAQGFSLEEENKRVCKNCGCDISSKPKYHKLCYDCWKTEQKKNDSCCSSTSSYSGHNDWVYDYSESRKSRIQRDNGLSDDDMDNGGWIDF